jgi:hypothetical protein
MNFNDSIVDLFKYTNAKHATITKADNNNEHIPANTLELNNSFLVTGNV